MRSKNSLNNKKFHRGAKERRWKRRKAKPPIKVGRAGPRRRPGRRGNDQASPYKWTP